MVDPVERSGLGGPGDPGMGKLNPGGTHEGGKLNPRGTPSSQRVPMVPTATTPSQEQRADSQRKEDRQYSMWTT